MAKRAASRQREDRTEPHSLEAERAVLGAILVNNASFEKAAVLMRGGMVFYRQAHREIYEAIAHLIDVKKSAVDILTTRDELLRRGVLDDCGGASYISGLTDGVPRATNVGHYARIVFEHAIRRGVIRAANEMLLEAFDAELPASDLLNGADRAIVELQRGSKSGRLVDLREVLGELYADIEYRTQHVGQLTGVPTGWDTMDRLTLGWQAGDMIVVGARPSMGKTAFVLNTVVSGAATGEHVAVFSLEMRRKQLQYRMLANMANVPLSSIMGGYCTDEEMDRLGAAMNQLATLPIHVDDRSGQTVEDIRATCRRLRAGEGLGMVVVDYIQLMPASVSSRGINRTQELTFISNRLKELADEVSAPVFVLSQLKRTDGRPQLSDLRECGALEQDADLAILLHRKHHRMSGKTQALLEKQRNGPTGTVNLNFARDTQSFTDIGEDLETPESGAPADDEEPKARRRKRKPLLPG